MINKIKVRMNESGACTGDEGTIFYKAGDIRFLSEAALASLPETAYIRLAEDKPEPEEKAQKPKADKQVKKAKNK